MMYILNLSRVCGRVKIEKPTVIGYVHLSEHLLLCKWVAFIGFSSLCEKTALSSEAPTVHFIIELVDGVSSTATKRNSDKFSVWVLVLLHLKTRIVWVTLIFSFQ